MSSLLLPLGWCCSIEKHMKNFWWGFDLTRPHHLTLKSWQSICLPKALGGLGIRSLSRMNVALLGRQGWKLVSGDSSLWVSLCKAKYLRRHSFWDSLTPRDASWAWRGILKLIPYFWVGACKQICNGETTHVWLDPWVTHVWLDPWVRGMPQFLPRPRTSIHPEW